MASKNKLERFAEMESFNNIFQPAIDSVKEADFELKGKWATHFGNNHPIVLELGCGKGEYTIGLAKRYPKKNFIGIDIKGARIWKGAKQGEQEDIKNACFIRTKIDFITQFFDKNEVSEIWCTFSDPQPKKPNKRLTSKVFVERYKRFLKKNGIIHLKTDSDLLMSSTEEEVNRNKYQELFKTWDLYGEGVYELNEEVRDVLEIRTFYENIWLNEGKSIKYIKFQIEPVS